MKPQSAVVDAAKGYLPREYWTDLAQGAPAADFSGFAPILHPDAPAWFNRLIDDLQFRAVRRALALSNARPGERILDVGCGTGRWLRRYQDLGLSATGVDATTPMLRLARGLGTITPVVVGEAQRLPFKDAHFDLISDVTVVQHIPASFQTEAVREMARVLKPGGHMILMELIRGQAEHIFPRSPREWIELATSQGLRLTDWFGQEYLLLDRLFVRAALAFTRNNGKPMPGASTATASAARHSPSARRLYWRIRHVTAPLSAWTDPLAEKLCCGEAATHAVFIFQK